MIQIPLTQGYFAMIDDDMFDRVGRFKWWIDKCSDRRYARSSIRINGKVINFSMHQLIMGMPNGYQIDHIKGNGLDNRKENLRPCTQSQNHMNVEKYRNNVRMYKGVYMPKGKKHFVAHININRKTIYLLSSKSEIKCAKAYNEAALKYFGEFARLNIISDEL